MHHLHTPGALQQKCFALCFLDEPPVQHSVLEHITVAVIHFLLQNRVTGPLDSHLTHFVHFFARLISWFPYLIILNAVIFYC